MNTAMEQIDNSLEQIINHARKVNDILENEKILLTENNYERLEKNTDHKKDLVDALDEECSRLKNLFASLSLGFNKEGLEQLVTKVPVTFKDELKRKMDLMLDLLKRTEDLNQVNGILLVSRHNFNQQMLSFVTNTTIKPQTYAPYEARQAVSTRGHKA